jgi:hypothetical protein
MQISNMSKKRQNSNMSRKRQKLTDPVPSPASEDRLRQQMSEVISLREKVAQAELETRYHAAEEGRPGRRRATAVAEL